MRRYEVMERGTILVVDDEPNIADLVELYLRREGFRVVKAATGEDGVRAVGDHRPRLVILDVGLPDIDGLEVCRRLRQTSSIPVIFLTARDTEVDRVLGLELGADDYVTKPFSPAELVARVKAVLRRAEGTTSSAEIVQAGGVTIDVGRREVRVGEHAVPFTTKEFELLKFLADRPGLAMSRQQILDGVWGYDWFGDPRTVDVHIAQVRKKLESAVRIDTVRGVGYRLDPK
jgi:DNA-binding response OmpR family regulator